MPAGHYEHKSRSYEDLRAECAPRFWSKVKKVGGDGCWEWQAGNVAHPKWPRNLPYGIFSIKKRSIKAHRLAYELTYGEIPKGKCVLHHCDNALCVRPDHLYVGTYQDNMDDRTRRGRNRRTPEQIEALRQERKQRFVKDPTLRDRIGAAGKRQFELGIGSGSPEAIKARADGLRAYHAKRRLSKASKG